MVVLISAVRVVRDVEFSTRDFLLNDCIIVEMSVKALIYSYSFTSDYPK